MPLWKKPKRKEKPTKTDSSVACTRFGAPSINESMVSRVDVASVSTENNKNAKGGEIGEKQRPIASLESKISKWQAAWRIIQ